MSLTVKSVTLFALLVAVAYAPTFLLAGSIDGDEWVKSGAGALGLALVGIAAKLFAPLGIGSAARGFDSPRGA